MNKETITKKLTTLVHREHQDKYSRINPYRHWEIIVVLSNIIVAFLAIFSIYLYFQITHGRFFQAPANMSQSVKTIDRKKLSDTLDYLETKEQRFQAEKATPRASIDPGL